MGYVNLHCTEESDIVREMERELSVKRLSMSSDFFRTAFFNPLFNRISISLCRICL